MPFKQFTMLRWSGQRFSRVRRWPNLLPHRGGTDCSDRTQPKGIPGARAIQSARTHGQTCLGASGDCERQAVHPGSGHAVLLRCESEVTNYDSQTTDDCVCPALFALGSNRGAGMFGHKPALSAERFAPMIQQPGARLHFMRFLPTMLTSPAPLSHYLACLVSPKTNSPSPTQRLVPVGALKAISYQ